MGIRDTFSRATGIRPRRAPDATAAARHDGSAEAALDVARYTYLLRVSAPEVLEEVHRDAFGVLAAEQRERLLLRLRHDGAEGQRPGDGTPAELARAARTMHAADPRYLVRMLRRPGQGVTEGHSVPRSEGDPGGLLFEGSLLALVAAAAVGAPAAEPVLVGFENSPEAAQVNASVFVRSPGAIQHGAWEAGAGGVAGDSGGAG